MARLNQAKRIVEGATGALLVWRGLSRRSLPGVMVAFAGASLLRRAFAGAIQPRAARDPELAQAVMRFGDGSRDLVDEASWESFPASDPPAYY